MSFRVFAHAAATSSNPSRMLLEARARLDQRDVFGYDPLSAAAEEGRLEVVQILCRNRANVHLGSVKMVQF